MAAMKKSTPPKPPRPTGNAGGRVSVKVSPSVTVLGSKIPGFTQLQNPPRKSLTPAQLKEAEALAAKLKAKEVKAANEKKANAKIIKKQNKNKPLNTNRGATKLAISGGGKKSVVKVTPRGGRGMGGGMLGGGGMRGPVIK